MTNLAKSALLPVAVLAAALTALVVSLGVSFFGAGATPVNDVGVALTQAAKPADATEGPSGSDIVAIENRVQALTEELRQEQSSRLELQRQVARLEEQLVTTEARLQAFEAQGLSLDESSPNTTTAASGESGNAGTGDTRERQRSSRWGVSNATVEERINYLQQAGVDELSAREIVDGDDKRQLAVLELRDAASRGDWRNTEEFDRQMEELDASIPGLRTRLGDDAYDRYLFASGAPNRVRITNVLNGSAADSAGIQASDLILSYAGKRVFEIHELQRATREGVRGESVSVTLQRDGGQLDVALSRGPLGVSLERAREDPRL